MRSLTPPQDWAPADGLTLEDAAMKAVRSTTHTVVIAGPGAGKTELLAQRASYLLQTGLCPAPRRILAISFKRDAAANLSERVERRCGQELARRFESKTYDSFAKGMLDRFRLALPENERPPADYEIHWGGKRDTVTPNRLPSSLTFPEISQLVTQLLQSNPALLRALRATYSHLFLDEFQDTTQVQYDLLTTAFHGSKSVLTAVGDMKQRIMGWAGALPKAFDDFQRDFQPERLDLAMNYRSAPHLVAIQQHLAHDLDPAHKASESAKHDGEQGVCEIILFSEEEQEAEELVSMISKWVLAEGIPPREICLLSRSLTRKENGRTTYQYGARLISKLEAKGIQCRLEEEYQELLKEPAVSVVLAFLELCSKKKAPDAWSELMDLLIALHGYHPETPQERLVDLEEQLQRFRRELKRELDQISAPTSTDMDRYFHLIFDFIGMARYRQLIPQYQQGSFLDQLLGKTAALLARAATPGAAWTDMIRTFRGEDCIPVMTIHKSKGLEYDTVLLVGFEDNAFFGFRKSPEEEKSVLFVALSRAKRRVYLSASETRRRTGGTTKEPQTMGNIKPMYALLKRAGIQIRDLRRSPS